MNSCPLFFLHNKQAEFKPCYLLNGPYWDLAPPGVRKELLHSLQIHDRHMATTYKAVLLPSFLPKIKFYPDYFMQTCNMFHVFFRCIQNIEIFWKLCTTIKDNWKIKIFENHSQCSRFNKTNISPTRGKLFQTSITIKTNWYKFYTQNMVILWHNLKYPIWS